MKKGLLPVILSEAKDLLLFLFNEIKQMLRCAQHDKYPFSSTSYGSSSQHSISNAVPGLQQPKLSPPAMQVCWRGVWIPVLITYRPANKSEMRVADC